jgi:hypothetical protein
MSEVQNVGMDLDRGLLLKSNATKERFLMTLSRLFIVQG